MVQTHPQTHPLSAAARGRPLSVFLLDCFALLVNDSFGYDFSRLRYRSHQAMSVRRSLLLCCEERERVSGYDGRKIHMHEHDRAAGPASKQEAAESLSTLDVMTLLVLHRAVFPQVK